MIDFSTITPQETVDYFTKSKWGRIFEDDKYLKNAELEDNFIIFATYAFAHMNLPRPSKAQYYIALHLCDETKPHRMVWASRGLGKSIFSQLYVCWLILNNPNEKILVMSAGSDRAKSYTQFVKKLIALLPITKPMTPRHNLDRTSTQMFDVAGSGASDSPSMYAVGAGSQVTGMRASIIIFDDVETAQSVESTVKSEAINVYCMEAMNLLMSGKDESLTLCTPHSSTSMYVDWIDNRGFTPYIIPAIVPVNDSSYFGGLAPFVKDMIKENKIGMAVDDRINFEFLESKKMRIGKSKFQLQYMLDTSLSDTMKFPLKLSDFIVDDVDDDVAPLKISYSSMPDNMLYMKHNGFKGDKLYKPTYRSSEVAEYDYRVMSIDPSGRGADSTGISIGYHLNSKIFLKKVMGIDGGYEPDVLNNIATLAQVHKIDTIVVESNFGDNMYSKMLEPYLRKLSPNTELEEVRATTNKENRIIDSIEPILNSHRLVLDKGILDSDLHISRDNSLTYQLTHITREKDCLRHDDVIDSLAQLIAFMMEWLSDDEERGLEYHMEKEAEKALSYSLKFAAMMGSQKGKTHHNYANRF